MKVIARFSDPAEAQIAAGFLRAQGLEVEVADVHSLTAMPHLRLGLGGCRLMAEERDANIAKRLLADIQHETHEAEECPNCQGTRIANVHDIRFPLFHALLSFFSQPSAPTVERRCMDCQHTWRREDVSIDTKEEEPSDEPH